MFSDLHCHPTGRNFPHFSNNRREIYSDKAHPWVILKSKRKSLRLGKRATSYDQADFGRLAEGDVKLTFAALYPFEHGFFNQLYDQPLGNGTKYTDYFDLDGSAEGAVVSLVTGNSPSRIRFLRGNDYNYFQELKDEYDFICRKSGVQETVEIFIDSDDDPDNVDPEKKKITGTYHILAQGTGDTPPTQYADSSRSFKTRAQVDLTKDHETYVVLTIEGMHALSMKNQAMKETKATLMKRVAEIKKWDPPIFFMTFAHHFDNNLCSHAHSMFKIKILGEWNPDQIKNMNFWGNKEGLDAPTSQKKIGFSALGMEVIMELLNIKKSGNKLVPKADNGRRILIDTKHMSASSRLQYFNEVVEPYNNNNPDDIIPVIASHSAYTGDSTLLGLIKRYDNEEDDYAHAKISEFYPDYSFNPWNINLSDQDVHIIVETHGLIGLSFDERVLGASDSWLKKFKDKKFLKKRQPTGIFLLANNIIGMAEACRSIGKHTFVEGTSKYTFWDAITIGTDFNGVVDPVDKYPTAEQFDDFAKHLKTALLAYTDINSLGINNQNVDKVIEKICIGNSWAFVKKHF